MAIIRKTSGQTLISDRVIAVDADLLRIAIRENVDLRGADLSGWDLSRMDLSRLDFSSASFNEADLSGTSLAECNLQGTQFNGADLNGADFTLADVRGGSFIGARIAASTKFKDILFFGNEFVGAKVEAGAVSLQDRRP